MTIDINFKFYSDSNGGDPDLKSPTLRKYHKFLWSKPLPNGRNFELFDDVNGSYLYNKSEVGEFYLGSDGIAHSYRNHKRKKFIIEKIPNEVAELFELCSTVGGYIIFPNRKINGNQTINQKRGVLKVIDDRFDLTLECIRRFYAGLQSPLHKTLIIYSSYFNLFDDFNGYIKHFFLQDLVDENHNIKFYLPFDDFKSSPVFSCVDDYLFYKEGVMKFVNHRNKRIEQYIKGIEYSE